MKKLLFPLIMLFIVSLGMNAQESVNQSQNEKTEKVHKKRKWWQYSEKTLKAIEAQERQKPDGTYHPPVKKENKSVVEVPVNPVFKAGNYLQKSARAQYAAIGCAAASGVFIILGSNAYDADKIDPTDLDKIKRDKDQRDAYYIVAGIFAAGALVSEVCAINFKMKAGRSLKISANSNGAACCYKF